MISGVALWLQHSDWIQAITLQRHHDRCMASRDNVRTVKAQPGANLGVTGTITLCQALIAANLVDEYRLFVYPVVLGRGRRLFTDGLGLATLKLVEATPFQSGVVLLTYTRR
jgi:dihydrofolate reductase